MATGGTNGIDQRSIPGKKGSEANARVLSKYEGGLDMESVKLLHHVFHNPQYEVGKEASSSGQKDLDLQTLPAHLDSFMASIEKNHHVESADSNGRLGPENVVFDISGNVGTVVIEADRLGIASHSNFSSIRANTCVYKGCWVYELMLGSKGVMQVGWSTLACIFSREEGVGDTPDSYAYDGNRLRKWNVKTLKYGEAWLTGDVISCAIDCDKGTVTFYRNGHNLGVAFDDIRLGPGLAYFPAVSLSLGENLRVNFGATPLRYPISGYRPLQDPPTINLIKAQALHDCLERLLPSFLNPIKVEAKHICATDGDGELASSGLAGAVGQVLPASTALCHSHRANLLLIASHLFDKLSPLLKNSFIVEACLLRFLLKFCDSKTPLGEQPHVEETLNLLWAFLQDHEIRPCLEHLMVSLLSSYRFSPVTSEFSYQHMYLTLTLAILRHQVTRKYLLKNVLFDKIKFPIFLHVKPPDDTGLIELIPTPWWGFAKECVEDTDVCMSDVLEEEAAKKTAYLEACQALNSRVAALENIQVEILKVLLRNDDHKKGASSRFIFLHKFREFLKDNSSTHSRGHFVNQCPLPVSLCFFHRLIHAVRHYWDEYAEHHPESSQPSINAYIPWHRFCDDSINYFDTQRLGGLLSHLKKMYKDELPGQTIHGDSNVDSYTGLRRSFDSLFNGLSVKGEPPSKCKSSHIFEAEYSPSAASLVELVDGVIMLYNIAAHKQLGKMCSLRDNVTEYVNALEDTKKKLAKCPPELTDVKAELEHTRDVFIEKASEQARHMAWVIAVIYAKDKQEDVYWLLQVLLRTLERASEEEKWFSFVPDFYVDVTISAYNALRGYFHPTVNHSLLINFQDTLIKFASFLSQHFGDSRIVHSDVKDTLVQALACFVCYKQSLTALESIPLEMRKNMVKFLLSPYEKRSWAQTNWILVRLWKGCGYAFRYKHLPHLMPVKNLLQEIGNASLQKPCPSHCYQQLVAEHLTSNQEAATKLIDSLLNQLNWAFSEFIGMLQELQQISLRPMSSMVDSRQLKICATCFDISVGLLRVLEMIANLTPELFTDWKKPSAELLLCRLFQLLTQVLNRVTSRSNMFEMVVSVSVPGLETVDHFPILTAVTGILVTLILNGQQQSVECATAALLAEPGFQQGTLEFLLGGIGTEAASAPPPDKKIFSFKNYKEVEELEIQKVEELITHLRLQQNKAVVTSPDIDEESICNICYARSKSAIFKPCCHQSCRACIIHHLMNKKECFFCKTEITSVTDLEGETIYVN